MFFYKSNVFHTFEGKNSRQSIENNKSSMYTNILLDEVFQNAQSISIKSKSTR